MSINSNCKPVRVLHILQRMEAGGTQALLMNLYRNVDRQRIQFDFLVVYPNKQFYDDEIVKLGGKVYYTNLRKDFNVMKFKKELKRILLENDYRIVHVHAYSFGCFALSVAKECGVSVRIAHSHNNETVHDYKYIPKMIMQRLYTKNATDLFACSQAAGEYLFKEQSFQILKNAIDSKKFIFDDAVAQAVRSELNIPSDAFVVGHVGRFHPQKNHEFLLEVFARVREIESTAVLILVGSGDLESKIKNKVTDLGLTSNVLFLGNRRDMYRVYQAMDVFILPSLFEGLGIVAIEAQAAGVPCVCSDMVAKDACISPLFSCLSLKENAEVWAKAVVNENQNPYKHKNISSYIIDNGYDVSSSAIMMQDYYLQSLNADGYVTRD